MRPMPWLISAGTAPSPGRAATDQDGVHGDQGSCGRAGGENAYFVLIGPDLHTPYDLEALASSADLVLSKRGLSSLEPTTTPLSRCPTQCRYQPDTWRHNK